MIEFNDFWKFESLKIAAMEQLDMAGKLNIEKLFIRAKDIFDKGYEHNLQNWKSSWPEDIKPVNTVKSNKTEVINPDKKVCPKCNEIINKNWTKHEYKKDGEICGYTF